MRENYSTGTTLTASSAVLPFSLTRLEVAPDCSKNVTMSVLPQYAARCKAAYKRTQ